MKNLLVGFTVAITALAQGCMMDMDEEGSDLEVEDIEQGITGPGSSVSYTKGLVRLDFAEGGRCSAVLVGPNLLATAAHCVNDKTIDGVKTWNGMRYGKVRVRMVYKPTKDEVICLNEPCRSGGVTRYSTVFAFWDDAYSGNGNWNSDMAVLTRITRADFLTEPADAGDPEPRNLNNNDFLRIMNESLPSGRLDNYYMRIAGYGSAADNVGTANPRAGFVKVDDWNRYSMESEYDSGSFWSSTCKGDSGGPITYTPGIGSRTYVGGVTVGVSGGISGSCPEPGDALWFNRMSAKVWMLDRVREWIEGEDCRRYSTSTLPGNGRYFRCW